MSSNNNFHINSKIKSLNIFKDDLKKLDEGIRPMIFDTAIKEICNKLYSDLNQSHDSSDLVSLFKKIFHTKTSQTRFSISDLYTVNQNFTFRIDRRKSLNPSEIIDVQYIQYGEPKHHYTQEELNKFAERIRRALLSIEKQLIYLIKCNYDTLELDKRLKHRNVINFHFKNLDEEDFLLKNDFKNLKTLFNKKENEQKIYRWLSQKNTRAA